MTLIKIKFKFSFYETASYFKDGRFHREKITQRAYREIAGCGDNGETIIRYSFNEYKVNGEWIEEDKLYKSEEEYKKSPEFKQILKELGF